MSVSALFRRSHITKFFSLIKREGVSEAWRRAWYYTKLIALDRGRSDATGVSNSLFSNGFFGFWEYAALNKAFYISSAPALLTGRRHIAVIGDLNLPQCRKYRVEQLIDLWATGGIDVTFSHFEDFPRSADCLQRATHALLYRLPAHPMTWSYLYEANRLRLPVIYDIDDPLFSFSAYANYCNTDRLGASLRAHMLTQAPDYCAVMNACDAVSVSTPGMKEQAQLYTRRPIFLRRNFADSATLAAGRDASIHAKTLENTPRGFTVAFASGSRGHEADFDIAVKEIEQFICATPDRRLSILGQFDKDHLSKRLAAQTDCIAFDDYPSYLRSLAQADCAILPLADDAFNQCKSGVRLIDAASASVPAIISPVGDARMTMEPLRTGLIARSPGDWLDGLEMLAADRASARDMGRNARNSLETNWSAALREPIIDQDFVDWVRE